MKRPSEAQGNRPAAEWVGFQFSMSWRGRAAVPKAGPVALRTHGALPSGQVLGRPSRKGTTMGIRERLRAAAVLAAVLAGLGSGCAYVTAQPVKPGDRINGIRIYDVKPLLVVSGENVTIQIVPNYNRAYALRFGAFLAKNDCQAAMSNGLLTSVHANMDSTAFIELLKVLAQKIPEGFSGQGTPATPGGVTNRFQVYDIVFDDDGNLVGLRPLLIDPRWLNVTTAAARGFSGAGGGGTVVVQQPGTPVVVQQPGTGGVTPGPVQR